jgi:hypothetical protein
MGCIRNGGRTDSNRSVADVASSRLPCLLLVFLLHLCHTNPIAGRMYCQIVIKIVDDCANLTIGPVLHGLTLVLAQPNVSP